MLNPARSGLISMVVLAALVGCAKQSSPAAAAQPAADSTGQPSPAVPSTPVAVAVDPSDIFGGQDKRGAYQELRLSGVKVRLEYFERGSQAELKAAQSSKSGFQSLIEVLSFQDGQLKTRNPEATHYEKLDEKRLFVEVYALVGFSNLRQEKSGLYHVGGVITLVTGETAVGPIVFGGESPDFKQSVRLMNPNLGQGSFNAFGNGKNDDRRITAVGMISTSKEPMTLNDLRKAMGDVVQVGYPQ